MIGGQERQSRKLELFGFVTIIVVFGFCGAWAVFSNISGAIVSQASFEVERNRRVVQHLTGGTVAEIFVNEGDKVTAGSVLIEIEGAHLKSQLAIIENNLIEFMASRARLEAELKGSNRIEFGQDIINTSQENSNIQDVIDGQERLFQARKTSFTQENLLLDKRVSQINSEVLGIDAQIASLEVQLALIEEELKGKIHLLKKKLIPAAPVLSVQREAAAIGGKIAELHANRSRVESQATEIEIERIRKIAVRRQETLAELREMRSQENQYSERASALRSEIKDLSIIAPVSGVIYGMLITTPRSVVSPAEPILYLVPQDRPLVIVAKISVSDIDQVKLGQKVMLKLAALDQRVTPELNARVSQISADTFQDETTGNKFYRVEIFLDEGEQLKLPAKTNLIPGMPVEAFIRTTDQSPLSYLLQPITFFFNRALKEA